MKNADVMILQFFWCEKIFDNSGRQYKSLGFCDRCWDHTGTQVCSDVPLTSEQTLEKNLTILHVITSSVTPKQGTVLQPGSLTIVTFHCMPWVHESLTININASTMRDLCYRVPSSTRVLPTILFF